MRSFRLSPIWSQRPFRRFWLATSISALGSELSGVALPLTAVLLLNASTAQMGVLRATGTAPALLFGLFAGVWIDRVRRRPIMIAADVLRALLLGIIPLAVLTHTLSLPLLYAVAFAAGICTIFFDITFLSFVAGLVDNDDLLEANIKVSLSLSLGSVLGPSIAGVLVQLVTAPFVVALDALSFIGSALLIGGIARDETPAPAQGRRHILAEIGEGLRHVYGHALLRPMALYLALHFFCSNARTAVYLVYMLRELQIAPGWLGVILAGFGPGALVGNVVTQRITERFGMGATVVSGACLNCFAVACIPVAHAFPMVAIPLLFFANFSNAFGIALIGPMDSLRQLVTAPRLRGRMNASFRTVNMIMATLGALVGGVLGEWIGLQATFGIAAFGLACAALIVFTSPLRRVRDVAAPQA